MNLSLSGVHILINESGAICLAFLLTAVSTTTSVPINEDADNYGLEWEGTFDSIWNKTKFWLSDVPEPTEYFPETEGFIRVYSQKAKESPNSKVKKSEFKKTDTKIAGTERKQMTSETLKENINRGRRHLLQVNGGINPEFYRTEEKNDLINDGESLDSQDLVGDIFGGGKSYLLDQFEGSGEGSGFGNSDSWIQSSPTTVASIKPLTPKNLREI